MPNSTAPTPYPYVNELLAELLEGVRSILGGRLIGMYLDGSLTGGEFDAASDIDFLAVTEEAVTGSEFSALKGMHERLAAAHPRWGVELEGSYIPCAAVRRYDPSLANHPNLERGKTERLKWKRHGEDWLVHYHIVRERGTPLFGPDPKTLIDPVAPDDLRRAMRESLGKWWENFLVDTAPLRRRGYQSYAVLTMCRICCTLVTGRVVSKSEAAQWAKSNLAPRWAPLIDRAWEGRMNPDPETAAEEIKTTQEMIRYTLDYCRTKHPSRPDP